MLAAGVVVAVGPSLDGRGAAGVRSWGEGPCWSSLDHDLDVEHGPDGAEGPSESELATQLIEGAADVAGAAAAGALALLTGPEAVIAGQVGGSMVSSVLKIVAARIRRRVLEPRQTLRVGLAFTIAADHIATRLEHGAEPRADLFVGHGDHRPSAEELLEGVLRVAADEHQERKVRYLGRMYGELLFRPDISADLAAFLIRVAEALTWRQLMLTAYAGDLSGRMGSLNEVVAAREVANHEDPAVLYAEIDDLAGRKVIGASTVDGHVVTPASLWGSDSFRSLGIGSARLTKVGQALHDLMGLSEIPDEDLLPLIAAIHGS
jgi:hypothetical protein